MIFLGAKSPTSPAEKLMEIIVALKWTRCLEANPADVPYRTACYGHHCAVTWRFQGAKLAEVALELFYNPALCLIRHNMPSAVQLCSTNNVHGNPRDEAKRTRPIATRVLKNGGGEVVAIS
ncbi:uncharacterized protein LACBIDRAFT_332348 [Laccaria bicolor S238N-H82]|uniref:Predicted protein n=1 Tax=Laccaria bicolor (strain S238N-H82 / ATCC MYA-4686) TaxID=486041 RepID=B0DSF7_LACBS|nr:uncharacterized protein LACBIDRAFT_332348 [Laccaria bicolor S238N-H82]EDR02468.1 predicted protein [Laccaria bicolor S238N-H82]|eukprot:XP_001886831.1 predicted protein [Laccaria bicolor S238N-H82]